jgi:pimeloyl-ACP methyl ester carboxylesterase
MTRRALNLLAAAALAPVVAGCVSPSWGANLLLHPPRRAPNPHPGDKLEPVEQSMDAGVKLAGWRRRAEGPRRGTIIYLHGLASNRDAGVGIAHRFAPRGFDVLAYDSRAHGASGGDACTYGFYEKQDLARVIAGLDPGPVVLFGVSMGAAIALQEAAGDPRVTAIVAVAPISDLRTAVYERAPFFASRGNIEDALHIAESEAHFRVDDVSPVAAAPRITAPVLLIHGAADHETPPAHSRRVLEALRAPKQMILVPGIGHNDPLGADTWNQIAAWIDATLVTH